MTARPASLGSLGSRVGALSMRTGPRAGSAAAVLAVYAAVGVGASVAAWALERNPLACDAWLGTAGASAVLLSAGMGVCVAVATIASTRVMVQRLAWARSLHRALRPAVVHASDAVLLALAVAGALGEELLFRGLLVPTVGVVAAALVFGALHQIRGAARWGWMAWAALMGLVLGVIYAATGSLAGPVIAHAAINASNLRFLRDRDPDVRERRLGGLLRQGESRLS